MARLVRGKTVEAAKARLALVPSLVTQTRLHVRETWETAALLSGSDIGLASTVHSQLALHREGLRLALTVLDAPARVPMSAVPMSAVPMSAVPMSAVPLSAVVAAGAESSVEPVLVSAPAVGPAPALVSVAASPRPTNSLPLLADASAQPWLEQLLATDPKPLSDPDAALTLGFARAAHKRALEELETDVTLVKTWQQQRIVALGFACLATVALLVLGIAGVQRLTRPADLAAGKPFTLSSSWTTCHPENGECGGFPMMIAFHTNEQANPWYMVDLGAPTQFSSVSIRNRTDVALMRAVPLIVEVSDDAKTFKQVAQRDESFVEWEAKFSPQTARYVRVRVPRVTTLHLEAVRVHR